MAAEHRQLIGPGLQPASSCSPASSAGSHAHGHMVARQAEDGEQVRQDGGLVMMQRLPLEVA